MKCRNCTRRVKLCKCCNKIFSFCNLCMDKVSSNPEHYVMPTELRKAEKKSWRHWRECDEIMAISGREV